MAEENFSNTDIPSQSTEESSPPPRNKMRIFILILLAIVVVLVVAFYVGINGMGSGNNSGVSSTEPMVISPPDAAIKERPADPGGLAIPDQNKLVYNLIEEDQPEENVHTKPAPEPELWHKVEKPQTPSTKRVVSPDFIPPKSGDYRIQIASLLNQADATKEWQRLAKKYPLLKDMDHRIHLANLGDKGFRHRIHVGTFPTRESAMRVCSQLKASGGDCLVVKQP